MTPTALLEPETAMDRLTLWKRYQQYLCDCPSLDLTLDVSRMNFPDDFFNRMAAPMQRAYEAMDQLEAGAIANPDEKRMVGHYWLRNPAKAPEPELRKAIEDALAQIKRFTADVHSAKIKPQQAPRFSQLLVIGIGGSALGPQFVADALGDPDTDKMTPWFFDNTDPDGIDRVLRAIGDRLAETLTIVISKSGGTPETRNGMLIAQHYYNQAGLDFAKHAVAVTGEGSKLDQTAEKQGWLARFAMWDWVGGRTSETSAVGLLPAALQGIDINAMLKGAAACDEVTRQHDTPRNPAAMLALMWHYITGGKGLKDMVVLPYRDRLLLFSRYLQQLVMESLGKEKDLDGKAVHQGIAVYGNKGSTDQHAYVQQLREGVNNFFATFIEVLEAGDSPAAKVEVEPGVTCADYLRGFLLGTRQALHDNDRQSITITVNRADAFTIGVLIALYERAVGFYATLVNINAYHQPGVEAGKKAAAAVLELQNLITAHLRKSGSKSQAPQQIADAIGKPESVETIHHILRGLTANGQLK